MMAAAVRSRHRRRGTGPRDQGGCSATGAGVEFLSWLVEMGLPDPERVLADGSFAFRTG